MIMLLLQVTSWGNNLICFNSMGLIMPSLPLKTSSSSSDKLNAFQQSCPHKQLRKIKAAICNHQVDGSGDLQAMKILVIHDTECPY